MPREIVKINLASKFPPEVGARFFATIAHPNDRNERERYRLALCRFVVVMRIMNDPDLATNLGYIVPAIFVASDHDFLQTLKRGNKKLKHRLTVAKYLVMPHFRDKKLEPLQVEEDGEFIIPTLNKMTRVAMKELGWEGKDESVPTLKSKIWAPSRPVAHAAAAYSLWCYYASRMPPTERFVACLGYPPTIEALVQKAETYRLMLSEIDQFKIKEEETIQILAEGSPLETDDSWSAKLNRQVG